MTASQSWHKLGTMHFLQAHSAARRKARTRGIKHNSASRPCSHHCPLPPPGRERDALLLHAKLIFCIFLPLVSSQNCPM